ncbi:hypothetical protein NBRC110019_09780 [Neptunitalea chrysea]|uniref:Uncharacterized protein n=1 Tax=Neptunitalea chrysea TaxID=1647581 RepID=A0A9W6B3Q2_9FLAO|nr:hypothetical protein [Neptunitalea chrysea]GLB51939.1 hypothetical protein NBRC110019_09780 [Neptunitalea chrysea]
MENSQQTISEEDTINDYKISNFGVPGQIRAIKTYDRGVFVQSNSNVHINNNNELEKVEYQTTSTKDDLQLLKGIDTKIEKTLNENGFYTYEQLTLLPKEDKKKVSKLTTFLPKQLKIEDISNQAKLFCRGKEEFST